jgi:hypothetical protein
LLKNKEANVEKLAAITKVSSSILAVNNQHLLDKGVLSILEKNAEEAVRKRKESKTRKLDQQKKANDKHFSALQKMANNEALNKEDRKVLLIRHEHSQDSPIKPKVAELKVQF